MFQAITIKDPHNAFGFKRHERPNHEIQIKAKYQFMINYLKEFNFRNTIFTGDVFDKGDESKWSFKQWRLNKEAMSWLNEHMDINSNVGNHDMFFGLESSDNTVFGEMVKLGYINDISKKIAVYPIDSNIEDSAQVWVYGVNYSVDLDKVKLQLKWFDTLEAPSNVYKIVVMHSNITPEEYIMSDFTYAWLLNEHPNIGTFICGHYHVGFPTYIDPNNNSRRIINNWNFNRVVRDYQSEMNIHSPEFEHIMIGWDNIKNNFLVETKTIKIPCVPFEDAFDPKKIELMKKARKTSFQFFKDRDLQSFKNEEVSDDQFMLKIKENKNYADEVFDTAMSYLNRIED